MSPAPEPDTPAASGASPAQGATTPEDSPAVEVTHLSFQYSVVGTAAAAPEPTPILSDISINLPRGSRCLLIGANGAGKSTLLSILAGKRLTRSGARVLGQDVFFSTPPGVAYLGTEWAQSPVVRRDLEVGRYFDSIGGFRHKARRDALLNILDVDLSWHMHAVSDGERRRVQIVGGLMAPWKLLLLDEVTVDLDVLVRARLLRFLADECETRGATVLYATHIFDGLDAFPTHVAHMQLGTTPDFFEWPLKAGNFVGSSGATSGATIGGEGTHRSAGETAAIAAPPSIPSSVLARMDDPHRAGSRLLELALYWLEQDRKVRAIQEEAGARRKRGATGAETTDSEEFYKKYDYAH